MELHARVVGEPGAHRVGVCDDELSSTTCRSRRVGAHDLLHEPRKSAAVWVGLKRCVTWPVAISNAAYRSTTPWRRSRACAAPPGLSAAAGRCVRSALNRGLLSTLSTMRVRADAVESHHIRHLAAKAGSRLTLYVRTRCGLRPCARRVRHTATGAADRLASNRVVHRLRPAGGGDNANWRICSTVSAGTAWSRRPAFGRSRNPSTPASTNRRRMRETDSGDRSSWTAMSIPLAPAALSSTTRARRTTPAGADGRAITASNCLLLLSGHSHAEGSMCHPQNRSHA